jgi:integrase
MTVLQLFEHYVEDLEARGKGERNRQLIMARAKLHLKAWLNRPFVSITRAECRAAHIRITKEGGSRVANQVLGNFATAYKIALQTLDGDIPTDNPAKAVRLNRENVADYSDFSFEQMKADMARATPVMRAAVRFTLLSGLRKANVLGLQRDWVEADRLVIPRSEMKIKDPRRGPFVVPLSDEMKAIVEERMRSSNDVLLFPLKRLYKAHALRHMHYTTAQSLGLPQTTIDMLHDHQFGGMGSTYGSRQHFDFANLVSAQNAVTLALLPKMR